MFDHVRFNCKSQLYEHSSLLLVLATAKASNEASKICFYGEYDKSCRATSISSGPGDITQSYDLGQLEKKQCEDACKKKSTNFSCRWGETYLNFECPRPQYQITSSIDIESYSAASRETLKSSVTRERFDSLMRSWDRLEKGYLKCDSLRIGLYSEEQAVRKVWILIPRIGVGRVTCQQPSAPFDLALTYDGKMTAKLQASDFGPVQSADTKYLEIKNKALPRTFIGKKPPQGAAFPKGLIATTNLKFDDPAKWVVREAPMALQTVAAQAMHSFVNVVACLEEEAKRCSKTKEISMTYFLKANVEALEFVKSYKNKDDDFLIGFKINRKKMLVPPGISLCDKCKTNYESTMWREQESSQTYWYFASTKYAHQYLGRLAPIDAGDYDGDGQSEFLFYERQSEIPAPTPEIRIYAPDFSTYIQVPMRLN